MRISWRWLALIVIAVSLFCWKILFTRQFSLLLGYESANQAYAWYHYSAAELQNGSLALWDPFTHSGRSFVGEMQTALFYPPKVILYLWPFNRSGFFSPQLFHDFYVLTHILAAFLMFALAGDLGLRPFPAALAGIAFSLGGFVGHVNWPNMLDSAIWLPLILLFVNRAMRASSVRLAIKYSCAAGVAFGMAILAGSLHVAMMDVLAVTGFVAFLLFARRSSTKLRMFTILAVTGAVAFAAGAIQLLPSMEYSPLALRFLGPGFLPATERIPYDQLQGGSLFPRSMLAFLFAYPFSGTPIGSGEFSPYFGILPLLLAIVGIWRYRANTYVKYLAGLAGAAFYYSLGPFSLLHGILYAVTPFLWMAREAGRFIYLVHFAMALLAGFGVQALFESDRLESFARPIRILGWIVASAAAALTVPAIFGKPDVSEWVYMSFFQVLCAFAVLSEAVRGNRGAGLRFLLVASMLGDLAVFQWTIQSPQEESKQGRNSLEVLHNSKPMARFLQSRPGPFRVHFIADFAPNIGDVYRIQTTAGMSATMMRAYAVFLSRVPRALDLLNVRYLVRPRSVTDAGFVYEDGLWRIYENPQALPRAWVARRVRVEASPEKTLALLSDPRFDPITTALTTESPGPPALTGGDTANADIEWTTFESQRLELRVRSAAPGMLVLSELDYPGWHATLNGAAVKVFKVDGLFRGVVIPGGESRVVFDYAPRSVLAGLVFTLLSFFGTLGWFAADAFVKQASLCQSRPRSIVPV